MSGRPPLQALKEAKVIARRQGELCENTLARGILYDFAIHLELAFIYVRIRRVRLRELDTIDDLLRQCARDIAKLRKIPPSLGLLRELWVRESTGRWRYFLVHNDRIVEIPSRAMPVGMGVTRPIREDAPGPDRSSMLPETAPLPGKYFCPFMAVPGE
jgi:hypothetical protein